MRMRQASLFPRAAAAVALAFAAALPARAEDAAAPPPSGTSLEALAAQARAAAAAKRPAAPPPGAILGVYDPASRTFTPSAAIDPDAVTRGTASVRIFFVFKSGDAGDFPTIRCNYYLYSGSAAAKSYNTSNLQQDYSGFEAPKTVTLSYVYDPSRADNTVRLSVSCTAYDGNNVGHSDLAYKSFPVSKSTFGFKVTMTF